MTLLTAWSLNKANSETLHLRGLQPHDRSTIWAPKGWSQSAGGKCWKQWCHVGTWWNWDKGPPKTPWKKKQTNYSRRLKFPETSETFVDSLLLKWYLSNETAQEVLTWGIPRSYQFHSISGQLQNNPKPHIWHYNALSICLGCRCVNLQGTHDNQVSDFGGKNTSNDQAQLGFQEFQPSCNVLRT
jgi:hypothetical protein